MKALPKLCGYAVAPLLFLLAACAPPVETPPPTEPQATIPAEVSPTEEPAEPAATEEIAAKGGHLLIAMGYETGHFDPLTGIAYDQQYVHMNLFDPLIWRAPDGTFVPGLAESWEISDDNRVYTFKLRQDVKFHDGTLFNAEAVKFSFDWITSPDNLTFNQRSLLGPYEGTEVLDEYTVQVRFSEPFVPFLDALSQWWLVPVSPTAYEQAGGEFGQHPVGTGPFMWDHRVEQDYVTLVRNPDYNWAPSFFEHQGPAYLERITFKFVPEEASRVGVLESGEVLMSQDVPPVDINRLEGNPEFDLYREMLPGQPTILFMNTECTPTRDMAVRQALEWGTPKQQIIDTMWGGFYDLAYGPLTPGILGYNEDLENLYGYDVEKAIQILEEAGWVDSDGDGIREKDGEPLKLAVNAMSFNRYPEVLQLPVAAWRELGIDAELTVMTWPQFSAAAWDCEHSLMPYFTPASDPYFAMNDFYPSRNIDHGTAFSRLRNETLDTLIDEGKVIADPTERAEVYSRASGIIMQEAAILPLYVSYNLTMANASVKNLSFSAQGWYPLLYDVYVEQ